MKKELRSVMIIMLSIGMILGLCSCRMKESYKEFNIKNITGSVNDNYFTSEDFSFARIQNVVIIPEVKAINHEEYIIYIRIFKKRKRNCSNKKCNFQRKRDCFVKQ